MDFLAMNSVPIILTGSGVPYVTETSRLPHLLATQLTDGGDALSLMHWPIAYVAG
jgi:hypothetical protein